MKNMLTYLVGYIGHLIDCIGYIIDCIGTTLAGERVKRAFPIVSKTATMPIINYSLARARSAALINKTVTIDTFYNQLMGEVGAFLRQVD